MLMHQTLSKGWCSVLDLDSFLAAPLTVLLVALFT